MTRIFKTNELADMLKREEGFRSHAYEDHLGYATIGYGRCIEEDIGEQDNSECVECSEVPIDLNNDLSLNVMDVILIVGCVLSESCDDCSDLNEDGSTDIFDIVSLVNLILAE